MYTYLSIISLIFFSAFVSSLLVKTELYKNTKALVFSIFSISLIFIVWDYFATLQAHWAFAPDRIIGFKIAGLPVEEILFFPVVGFSMLFVYEVIKKFTSNKKIEVTRYFSILIFVFTAISIYFKELKYTSFVSLLIVALLLILYKFFPKAVNSKAYLLYIGLGFMGFLIFNYFLTSIPVVIYGEEITNIKITSIPVEDFLYNYLLLTGFVVSYEYFKEKS